MTTHADDGTEQESTDDSFTALQVGDDATVIYDLENHRAWVQSTNAVGLEDMS